MRDGEAFVPDLCAALDGQTLARDRFEVVFVDDRSRDRTRALLETWAAADPDRRRVVPGDGLGPARARNAGFRASGGDWIAFTDADVVPEAGWLEALVEAGDGVDVVEGRVEPWPAEAIGEHTHQIVNRDGGLYVTANMAYRRDVLERIGGFDERFRQPFLEDSDLAFRALDAGATIRFAPEASVRHRVIPAGTVGVLRSAARMRWLALLAAKHPRRCREQLDVRPLYRSDLHVLVGLAAAAAAMSGRGVPRASLTALALYGLARGLAAQGIRAAPSRELPARAVLAVAVPPLKAAWWLVGWVRFRKAGV